MDGVIVVDKAAGWTSHDVVNKVRRLANTRRVGHLGTLDPAATGVLPLVVGRATRLSQFYIRSEKVYDAWIHFGYATDTYDSDGRPMGEVRDFPVNPDLLNQHLHLFRGTIQQTPPPISAKKISGKRAYELARKNVAVELKPVEVTIHSLELLACEGAQARIQVHCSAGTYLRSIAHELGQSVGCGAYLKSLRRLRCGDFDIADARPIEELQRLAEQGRLEEALVPPGRLLTEFPVEVVDSITERQIRQGRDFRVSPFRISRGAKYVRAVNAAGELLAIGEARLPNLYHPILVL
jgi:tRNA pseudouridine55 synthase